MIFATHELSLLLKVDLPRKGTPQKVEEQDMLDAFEDLLDADKRAKNKKKKIEAEEDSVLEEEK